MPVRDDPVREQIMQAGGRQLRVAIRPGTGTGPPLLLCNGIGMRLEAFQPFVDALDPAIEVIRFDAPGTGGSQLPSRPYRFTTLALLLREMLHKLGHQQADVLGISWGGGLAQNGKQSPSSSMPSGRSFPFFFNLPFGSGGSGTFFFKGSPTTRQPAFAAGHQARYPASYTDARRREIPVTDDSAFLFPFGCRHSLLGCPVPATGFRLPCGWPTTTPIRV